MELTSKYLNGFIFVYDVHLGLRQFCCDVRNLKHFLRAERERSERERVSFVKNARNSRDPKGSKKFDDLFFPTNQNQEHSRKKSRVDLSGRFANQEREFDC